MQKYIKNKNTILFNILMLKTKNKTWVVKVLPCDTYGKTTGDARVNLEYKSWFKALRAYRKYYRYFYEFVN